MRKLRRYRILDLRGSHGCREAGRMAAWSMPRMQLPTFLAGVNDITNDIGYEGAEEMVVYHCGTMPVFSHHVDDLDSFRMITSQLASSTSTATCAKPTS